MPFPPSFTNNWDQTFPLDTELANLIGANLRQLRVDVMQRMSLLSGTLANRPTPEIVNATWGGAGFGLIYFATDTQQIFQWNGAVWNQIFTIVNTIASLNFVAQNAAIPGTTLYNIPVGGGGLYRLSFNLVLTTNGTGGNISGTVTYTNENGVQGVGGVPLPTTGPKSYVDMIGTIPNCGSFVFSAVASTAILISTTFTGVTGAPVYNARARLEFLG